MILYHASTRKNLTVLRPQRTLSHDKYIGDYVFATKSSLLAHMYLVPKGIAILMDSSEDHPNIVMCISESEFLKRDHGGAVFELSSASFAPSPQQEINDYEMVSTIPVKPLKKTVYAKTRDALLALGIQIRFVDKDTFKKLINNPNQKKLVNTLEPYQLQ